MGKESLLPLALKDFYRHMNRNASVLKYKIRADELFPTKILFAMDEEVQRWLQECEMARCREEVNDSLLNKLTDIIDDVTRGRLHIILPEVFKLDIQASKDSELSAGQSNKKRKLSDDSKDKSRGKLIKNEDPNEAYKLLAGEDYKAVFCGKNVCHRVDWDNNGTKMCPRYHSRWYCFDNCNNIASHVPKNQVPADKDNDYKRYLKRIRNN